MQRPEPLGGSVAVSFAGWLAGKLGWFVGWLVDRLGALGSGQAASREGFGGVSLPAHLVVFGVVLSGCWGCLFCFHIMLFCSEFTSEEFSSPRILWFSCLGVRELWMLRESSSLVGAFTGSSSLFWELGSSYPGRGGGGGLEAESTVRTTTTGSCSTFVAKLVLNFLWQILSDSSELLLRLGSSLLNAKIKTSMLDD